MTSVESRSNMETEHRRADTDQSREQRSDSRQHREQAEYREERQTAQGTRRVERAVQVLCV